MESVIKAENIGKLYRLGEIGTGTISHDLNRWWHKVRGKEDPYKKIGQINDHSVKGDSAYAWALKDVSFEINEGDVLGIIGKNGAGKSTLLKILSRITSPTEGRIRYKGRIASLLEVGTGFHPELTGKDNIFLNGAILGMSKREIKSKLDEIIDFAGIEKYIDTPVKRYSSGMYVRLAFAVAAFLEPEILVVDEVLAVGDAEFQKKCLGRMKDISVNDGRTVLFVSHNMAAVKQLCTKGIVLSQGNLAFTGSQNEAIGYYQRTQDNQTSFHHIGDIATAPGNQNIRITKFEIKPIIGDVLSVSSGFSFEAVFYNYLENINLDISLELKNMDETQIFHNGFPVSTQKDSKRGFYTVKGSIQPDLLNSGYYKFKVIFGQDERYALYIVDDFIQFELLNEVTGSISTRLPGILKIDIPYEFEFSERA